VAFQSTAFMRGFSGELVKLAAMPVPANLRPRSAAYANAIPVQRIPSGPSPPAPQSPPRPATPTGPAYQPPQPAAPPPKKGGSGAAGKPVGSAWLQMSDRAPTESTSGFVSRQYGVPEYQMGVNQGKPFSGRADDPQSATVVTQPKRGGMHGIAFAGQPTVQAKPMASPEAQQRVPSYLQKAVGGFQQPKLWLPRWGNARDPNYLRENFIGAQSTSAAAMQQPAQAAM
jgi:hypothetical protein